jgi:hypothetical protein
MRAAGLGRGPSHAITTPRNRFVRQGQCPTAFAHRALHRESPLGPTEIEGTLARKSNPRPTFVCRGFAGGVAAASQIPSGGVRKMTSGPASAGVEPLPARRSLAPRLKTSAPVGRALLTSRCRSPSIRPVPSESVSPWESSPIFPRSRFRFRFRPRDSARVSPHPFPAVAFVPLPWVPLPPRDRIRL